VRVPRPKRFTGKDLRRKVSQSLVGGRRREGIGILDLSNEFIVEGFREFILFGCISKFDGRIDDRNTKFGALLGPPL
jgi:hypothetical protein